jgi:hypothetical protein
MTLVGAAVLPTTGQTWVQAITAFETATGRALPVRRCYDSTPPSSVAAGQLAKDVGTGRKVVYSIKATSSTSLSTLGSLAASIVDAELDVDLILHHEPVDDYTNGADYIAMYQRNCVPFRDAGIPVGVCYTNWSCNLPYSDADSALAHFWPGDDVVDFVSIDEYPYNEITSTKDATPMELRCRRIEQWCDARGLELGLAEYGVDIAWDPKKADNWLRSVTTWARRRVVEGNPLRWMTYFSCDPTDSPYNWTITNKQEYVDSYIDSYRILDS